LTFGALSLGVNVKEAIMTPYTNGCKQDQTSQQCYFRKGQHVLLPKNKIFIQMSF
jgi:hypothetical protein